MGKTSTNVNVLNDTKDKLNDVTMFLISKKETTNKSYNTTIEYMCDFFLNKFKEEINKPKQEEEEREEEQE